MGVFTMSFASALMVGSPLGGEILARLGPGPLWLAAFLLALLGAALYQFISPAIRRAHESASVTV
jgi:predicted MFS family arabinose efflux permease